MKRLITLGFAIAAAALTATGQLVIKTTSLPPAVISQPYTTVPLESSGDPGPIVWSAGNPPPGFTIVSGSGTTGSFCYGACFGTIVQTPVGNYGFTLTARSLTTSQITSVDLTLLVVNQLQIVTTSLPNAQANQTYSTQLQGFGGTGQFRWSILSGPLPVGITLDPATGALSGPAPGVNATYPITVQLQDQVTLFTTTRDLSITIINGVAILTDALPNAIVNQGYSFQLQGTGQNLVWSVPTGAQLPAGFTLSSSGVITGVGTATGIVNFPIQLVNAQFPGSAAFRLLSLQITLGVLGIVETAIPAATQNVPYSTTLTPTGGIPPYTWSLGISNPQGISIGTSTGIISGTPTAAGSFPLQVTLRDSAGTIFTQNYILNVGTGVAITTTSLPNGSPNVFYSATLAATGGVLTYRWNTTAGALPPGLNLHSDSGVIDGTPTAQGTFPFTVQVTDFKGGTATKALSITIGQFLVITTTTLPAGALTQPYSATLAAINGAPPYTWSVATGALPGGLQLSRTPGVISGTPTAAGNFTFDILVTDSNGGSARRTFTINIATNPVVVTSGDFTGNVLTAFTQTLTATGGTPPYTWSIASGTLPGGLQLNSATGVISGTPSPGGTSQVTFTATDTQGLTGSKTITITIIAPPAPAVSISLGTTTQPAVSLATGAPYPLEITGFLTLTFTSSVGGTDDMVRFSDGTRKVFFVVRPNTTQGLFTTVSNGTPAIVTGTVAGTITLTASMSAGGQDITPSQPPTQTITIAPGVPVITTVALQQVTGGLNVVVTGYSNTREVSSGSFTFTVSSGNTLSQATITVPTTSAYAAWFGSTASNATGGQFKLTVPFSVTQGSATAVTRVSVTLTNTKGASAAVSSP